MSGDWSGHWFAHITPRAKEHIYEIMLGRFPISEIEEILAGRCDLTYPLFRMDDLISGHMRRTTPAINRPIVDITLRLLT